MIGQLLPHTKEEERKAHLLLAEVRGGKVLGENEDDHASLRHLLLQHADSIGGVVLGRVKLKVQLAYRQGRICETQTHRRTREVK